MAEAERLHVSGRDVHASDRADVLVGDPDPTACDRELPRPVPGLVGRLDPAGAVDLVERAPSARRSSTRIRPRRRPGRGASRSAPSRRACSSWGRCGSDRSSSRSPRGRRRRTRSPMGSGRTIRACTRAVRRSSRRTLWLSASTTQIEPAHGCQPREPEAPALRPRDRSAVDDTGFARVDTRDLVLPREPHVVPVRQEPAGVAAERRGDAIRDPRPWRGRSAPVRTGGGSRPRTRRCR